VLTGFPVELCGATEMHAVFCEESRTSVLSTRTALTAQRKSGKRWGFSWFSPKGTSRSLSGQSNWETTLEEAAAPNHIRNNFSSRVIKDKQDGPGPRYV
jgi:hypothetical protein